MAECKQQPNWQPESKNSKGNSRSAHGYETEIWLRTTIQVDETTSIEYDIESQIYFKNENLYNKINKLTLEKDGVFIGTYENRAPQNQTYNSDSKKETISNLAIMQYRRQMEVCYNGSCETWLAGQDLAGDADSTYGLPSGPISKKQLEDLLGKSTNVPEGSTATIRDLGYQPTQASLKRYQEKIEKHAKEVDDFIKKNSIDGKREYQKTLEIEKQIEAYIPKSWIMSIEIFPMCEFIPAGLMTNFGNDGPPIAIAGSVCEYGSTDTPLFGPQYNVKTTKDLLGWKEGPITYTTVVSPLPEVGGPFSPCDYWGQDEKGNPVPVPSQKNPDGTCPPQINPVTTYSSLEEVSRTLYQKINGVQNTDTLLYDPPAEYANGWYFYGYGMTKEDVIKANGAGSGTAYDYGKAIGFAVNSYDISHPGIRYNDISGGGFSELYFFRDPNPYIAKMEGKKPVGGKLYQLTGIDYNEQFYVKYVPNNILNPSASLITSGIGDWDVQKTSTFYKALQYKKISKACSIIAENQEVCEEKPVGDFGGNGCSCQV